MAFRPSDLTTEKSLLAIRLAARKIPTSTFNQWVVGLTAVLIGGYSLLPASTAAILAAKTREIADMGFGFATSILGFLIAGFTVFATITKEELFKRMAVFEEPKSRLSYLKYNFFAFMKVFIDYLSFCGLCVFIKLAAFPDGPISTVVGYLPGSDLTKLWLARIGFILITATFVYVLLLLKSFVFNTHHVVMTSLRWSMEEDEDRLKQIANDP
jgi:hypothetical protein